MADSDRPIAWTALEKGTSVLANDGSEIGKVSTVVADENKDIFSGIAFRHGFFDSEHFVPADLIETITPDEVRVALSSDDAGKLERYEA
ncbi:MAG: PRC-barrel domain-containing protein [Actinomycetota bacterium]|nr:PRC-barrel domain-containing protein [Actinomycetota bacterium]